MLLSSVAVLLSLVLLIWSADRFVEAAANTAGHLAVPPLLVGLLVVGFGSSASELAVSTLAAGKGHPALALGNAWGSNIANLALVLGVTALVSPLVLHSMVLRQELPWLFAVTVLTAWLAWDLTINRMDAWLLLLVFACLVGWSIRQARKGREDALASDTASEWRAPAAGLNRTLVWLVVGLAVLLGSSQLLVWGAVTLAQSLGVSDLVVGLTVVALGTTLPEGMACVAAARKGEHDLALGHVLGACLFNALAVVGVAGAIAPIGIDPASITRDLPVMAGLTLVVFALGWGFRGRAGRIPPKAAVLLLAVYAAYLVWLLGTLGPG